MTKLPQGVEKSRGAWGITYSYKGIRILKASGSYSYGYDFKVGKERILASNLIEAVQRIEKVLQSECGKYRITEVIVAEEVAK